ncbi:MAG: DUF4097 family beta strand repeat-containing protein [Vicinamibacteria bacterium]
MRRFVVFLLLAALSGCNPYQAEETETEEFRFATGPSRPSIEVRLEEGSIEIRGSESSSVEAEFVRRARSVDSEAARALLERIEVSAVQDGDRIRFEGGAESLPSFGRDLRTDLTLRVPRDVNVDVQTGDGVIEIQGIAGEVVAETSDGRIHVERVAGELRLRSEDGSIRGLELDGPLEASTDDGEIALEGTFPRLSAVTSDGDIRVDCREWPAEVSDWVVRTSDGSIFLTLPGSVSAEVDATTSDGRIVNRLSSLEGAEREGRLRGKLGSGGPLLLLSTMDGLIELSER